MNKKEVLLLLPLIVLSLIAFSFTNQEVKKGTTEKAVGYQQATWLKIRVHEKGDEGAQVIVNIPITVVNAIMAHKEELIKLVEEKEEHADKGVLGIIMAASIWEEIQKLGPTELVEVIDKEDGTTIKIWLE
jgi:hypothetical protein